MAIKASVLTGPTNLMAMFHPFAGPAGPYIPSRVEDGVRIKGQPVGGVPIMIDIDTGEIIVFDPWLLKKAGIIHSPYGIVLGPKGHGKSSCMKIIANRLSWLTAGYDMMRISVNDYKPEGDASEYGLFASYLESVPFAIKDMEVNPFESRLFTLPGEGYYELGILRMAEIFGEFAQKSPLIGNVAEAMRIGVSMMLRNDPSLWMGGLLQERLRSIQDEDIDRYYGTVKQRVVSQLNDAVKRVMKGQAYDEEIHARLLGQIRAIEDASDNVDRYAIKQAGVYASTLLGNIFDGSMKGLFGSKHSLYDTLVQRAATMDWRGVPTDGETLMRTVLTEVKIAAIENNRVDLLPHLELDDEKHRAMEDPVYAKSHSYMSEIARATHNCNISATHRLGSIRKGQYGDTIINNLGFQIIGKHEGETEALEELRARYGLSDRDMQRIPMLPDYTFGIRLGDKQRIRYGRVFALPSEMQFLPTNSATDRMIDRPGVEVMTADKLEYFASRNGIRYLGFDEAA